MRIVYRFYHCASVIVGSLAVCAAGCQSYHSSAKSYMEPYHRGDYKQAAAMVAQAAGSLDSQDKSYDEQSKSGKGHDRDRVLLRLEQGTIDRAAGDYASSNKAFEHVNQLFDEFDEMAKTRVSQESGALLINQTAMEYTGNFHDRVMLSTYRALNYLEEGQFDAARAELIAAYQRQQDTVAEYAKQIEEKQKKIEKEASKKGGDDSADINKSLNDPGFKEKIKEVVPREQTTGLSDYINPFSEYLQGIYFAFGRNTDGSDHERGRVALHNAAGLAPHNTFVTEDVELAERMAGAGAQVPAVTYVFFETGMAPIREEIRIDVPVFLFNLAVKDTGVDYVGVAFPKLRKIEDFVPHLMVDTPQGTKHTMVLANMDLIIAREFKNELPIIITRTVASAVTKAAIAYAANKGTQSNSYANAFTRIGSTIYQGTTNRADLRTWETLPKQIQVARILTPQDRQIRLSLSNGAALPAIALIPGTVNVVYIKSSSVVAPPTIHQFTLR